MILTFDCYGTLLDTSSINECISNICYENNVNSQLAINAFFSYEDRLMYSDEIIPYEKLIRKNLQFMDMDLDTDDLFLSNYKAILQAYYDLKTFSGSYFRSRRLEKSWAFFIFNVKFV
ncbi:hypothetical protein [Oenococcus oeni]|nr:hypothetical protein [Oenococcus oeni]